MVCSHLDSAIQPVCFHTVSDFILELEVTETFSYPTRNAGIKLYQCQLIYLMCSSVWLFCVYLLLFIFVNVGVTQLNCSQYYYFSSGNSGCCQSWPKKIKYASKHPDPPWLNARNCGYLNMKKHDQRLAAMKVFYL